MQQLMTLSTKCVSALVLQQQERRNEEEKKKKKGFSKYVVFKSKHEQDHAANTVS